MTELGERMARLIAAQGPMSLAQFMAMALHDPQGGYYATREPFGAQGDFITAPEISQMFGELLGLWAVQCWIDQGKPAPAHLVELGPGRGTLMADALRAARLAPDFLAAIEVVLVENSAALREKQRETLKNASVPVRWLDGFDESLQGRPLFLLANEFFDALPIRQFVKTPRGWNERVVTIDRDDALAFAMAPLATEIMVPSRRGKPDDGAIYEISPAATAIVSQIAAAIEKNGGAALIVDYGYGDEAGFGDTLQAVGDHRFVTVLDNPGAVDLSAHVDFAALASAVKAAGARPHGPIDQGALLDALGIRTRAAALARSNRQTEKLLADAVTRLTASGSMGTLFKALAITARDAPVPSGFGHEEA